MMAGQGRARVTRTTVARSPRRIGFLTGYRNRVGAVLGWWFAFTRDIRRERTFTIDDMPVDSGAYGGAPRQTLSGTEAHSQPG